MDLKLSAAIRIKGCHRELTPSSQKASCPPEQRITWRQWWERRFNDDYGRYIRQNWDYFKPEPTQ